MKNIVLIGFMGSGKTELAYNISSLLKVDMIDTDYLIVENEGIEISDIFKQSGEEYFRKCEREAVIKAASAGGVIATGGGVPTIDENVSILRENGIIYYLDVDFEVLYSRIASDKKRPIASSNTKDELALLFNKRKPFYEKACDYKIECGSNDALTIAKQIVDIHEMVG